MKLIHISAALCVAVAMLVTACASSGPKLPDDRTIRINLLLDEVSKGVAEEDAPRCLSTRQYGSIDVIDGERLIFRARDGRAWLNELRPKCVGLRRNDRLLLELSGSRACAKDRVSTLESGMSAGPTCSLGRFIPIPPGYLQRIDEIRRSK